MHLGLTVPQLPLAFDSKPRCISVSLSLPLGLSFPQPPCSSIPTHHHLLSCTSLCVPLSLCSSVPMPPPTPASLVPQPLCLYALRALCHLASQPLWPLFCLSLCRSASMSYVSKPLCISVQHSMPLSIFLNGSRTLWLLNLSLSLWPLCPLASVSVPLSLHAPWPLSSLACQSSRPLCPSISMALSPSTSLSLYSSVYAPCRPVASVTLGPHAPQPLCPSLSLALSIPGPLPFPWASVSIQLSLCDT